MKDTNFYDAESAKYSSKRYPVKTTDYIHYFFKKRLMVVLELLEKNVIKQDNLKLLEVGCADGVVIEKIEEKFNDKFNEMQGIDLSPQMIESAKKNSTGNSKIKYSVRDDDSNFENKFDIIIEVGVANYTDFLTELKFAQKNLRADGYFILSIAGSGALAVKLGKTQKEAFNNLLKYQDYEKMIAEYFDIIKIIPCGFWLPKLWKLQNLAKIMQPVLDYIFSFLLPDFFHEKVYLLKIKK